MLLLYKGGKFKELFYGTLCNKIVNLLNDNVIKKDNMKKNMKKNKI
jgi:hypothetical protein